MTTTVVRHPVLVRLPRCYSRRGYTRTRQPTATTERPVLVVKFRPARVIVDMGLSASMEFSLRTGRAIGNPDWLLDPESLRKLRAQVRQLQEAA